MKKGMIFAGAYGLFILLVVGLGLYYSTYNPPENIVPKKNELTQSEKETLKTNNDINEKNANDHSDKKKLNPVFALTAVSIAAVLDIVIVILWANHENKKKSLETEARQQRKRQITDSPVFWWIIGLGIVQKKNDKLIVNWKYVVLYLVVGLLVKLWITREFL